MGTQIKKTKKLRLVNRSIGSWKVPNLAKQEATAPGFHRVKVIVNSQPPEICSPEYTLPWWSSHSPQPELAKVMTWHYIYKQNKSTSACEYSDSIQQLAYFLKSRENIKTSALHIGAKAFPMGRWMKPEVYPLLAAMTCVTSLCIFQLTRNVFLNPDVRINKAKRSMGVLGNNEEGERYAEHGLRRFLRTRPPEIMPAINHFFTENK
ncbi:hypothetical protein POTOM_015665 [Populus tomentosa]|uniref:Uncharacterized protein n=1 Tax=Populus tomentosa TaxID=118781 RepID=A0A8X8A3B8_POPTO|nr:hypothetical protein POTOM_015665 [Populus tomentosa]